LASVKKLIAGPSVYICDGCTGLAKVVPQPGFNESGALLVLFYRVERHVH